MLQRATHATKPVLGWGGSLAWMGNGKGMKRKADDLGRNSGKRARDVGAPTGLFNDDVSIPRWR